VSRRTPGTTGEERREMHADRPLRIAHVITRLIRGGAQETAVACVEGLRRSRLDVDLISGPTYGKEGSVLGEAAAKGVVPSVVPSLRRHVNPILDLVAFVHLVRLFRRGRYDIVHTHSSKAGIIGRLAARAVGVPLVVHTVHGWPFSASTHPVVRRGYVWLERVCARLSDALVVVTPLDTEAGLDAGVGRRDLFHTVRSGIDLEHFRTPSRPSDDVRREWGVPAGVPVVGAVMRLSDQKAPVDWVRVAARVAEEVPDAWFVIVGDGPLRERVEDEARALGIHDRLRITGMREDVPDLLSIFDLFLLTSLWEGLPRVLPQAMSAGLPIVATRVDGNAEAVVHGETGYLAAPRDIAALAGHVTELLTTPSRARELGARGRESADVFDERRMIQDLRRLYESLGLPA
jgi:glycosyltransferase involved in cell wall biosynthesis